LPTQADLFKPNYYLSLHAFRELTLKRLQAFVAAKFNDGKGGPLRGFDVRDYLNGEQPVLCCAVARAVLPDVLWHAVQNPPESRRRPAFMSSLCILDPAKRKHVQPTGQSTS